MSRIAATFEKLASARRKALIPYITAGFPFPDITPALMHAMVEAGVLGGVSLGRLYPNSDALKNGLVVAVTEVVSAEDIDALEAALKEAVK